MDHDQIHHVHVHQRSALPRERDECWCLRHTLLSAIATVSTAWRFFRPHHHIHHMVGRCCFFSSFLWTKVKIYLIPSPFYSSCKCECVCCFNGGELVSAAANLPATTTTTTCCAKTIKIYFKQTATLQKMRH